MPEELDVGSGRYHRSSIDMSSFGEIKRSAGTTGKIGIKGSTILTRRAEKGLNAVKSIKLRYQRRQRNRRGSLSRSRRWKRESGSRPKNMGRIQSKGIVVKRNVITVELADKDKIIWSKTRRVRRSCRDVTSIGDIGIKARIDSKT